MLLAIVVNAASLVKVDILVDGWNAAIAISFVQARAPVEIENVVLAAAVCCCAASNAPIPPDVVVQTIDPVAAISALNVVEPPTTAFESKLYHISTP